MRIMDEKLKTLSTLFFQLEKDLDMDLFIFMQQNFQFQLSIELEKREFLNEFVDDINNLYQKEVIIVTMPLIKTLEFHQGPEMIKADVKVTEALHQDLRRLLMR